MPTPRMYVLERKKPNMMKPFVGKAGTHQTSRDYVSVPGAYAGIASTVKDYKENSSIV